MKGVIQWGRKNKDLKVDDYSDRCNRNPKDESNPCWLCSNNNWVMNTCKIAEPIKSQMIKKKKSFKY